MADDRPQLDFDLDTDEGLEAYVLDLEARSPVPERLCYPESEKAWSRALEEADGDETYTLDEVRAHFAERVAGLRSPPGSQTG